jgi:hypothetical protein
MSPLEENAMPEFKPTPQPREPVESHRLEYASPKLERLEGFVAVTAVSLPVSPP